MSDVEELEKFHSSGDHDLSAGEQCFSHANDQIFIVALFGTTYMTLVFNVLISA